MTDPDPREEYELIVDMLDGSDGLCLIVRGHVPRIGETIKTLDGTHELRARVTEVTYFASSADNERREPQTKTSFTGEKCEAYYERSIDVRAVRIR